MEIENIGKRIRKRRNELKLTMEQLAEKIGLTTGYVGNIERGESVPSIDTLVRIANSLSVNMDYLCQDVIAVSGEETHNYAISQIISKMQKMSENKQMALLVVFESIEKAMLA